jgi:hypothetical protein
VGNYDEQGKYYEAGVDEVHDELVKLNATQARIADSLERKQVDQRTWLEKLADLTDEVEREALKAFGADAQVEAEELGVVADELDTLRQRWILKDEG